MLEGVLSRIPWNTVVDHHATAGKVQRDDVAVKSCKSNEAVEAWPVRREQLVDVAILIGTDFNDGVKGYGSKKSLKLIKKAGSLKKAVSELPATPSMQEIDDIQDIFLHPAVTDDYSLRWSAPDHQVFGATAWDGPPVSCRHP